MAKLKDSVRHPESHLQAEILDYTDTLYFALDPEGHVSAVHPKLAAMQGREPAELIGLAFESAFPRYTGTMLETTCRHVQERRVAESFEWREPVTEGHSGQWLAIRVQPLSTGIAAIFRNNTEQKELSQALAERGRFIENISEVNPAILYLFNTRLNYITFFDRQIGQVLGYSRSQMEELQNNTPEAFMHPEDQPRFRDHLAQLEALPDGTKASFEYRMRCADGSYKWFLAQNLIYMRDSAGRAVQILGSAMEVTGIRNAVQALATSEERYRLAARATNDVIWDWDLHSDITHWSETMVNLFGHAETLAGTDTFWWQEHLHPADRERVVQSLDSFLVSNEEQWSVEYRIRRADGSYALVFDRGWMMRDSEGQPERMIGAMQDISRRRQLEAHDRFLVEIGDALAAAGDEAEAIDLVTQRLGTYLNTDRCVLVEDIPDQGLVRFHPDYHNPDLPPISGDYSAGTFPEIMRLDFAEKEQVVIEDTATHPRTMEFHKEVFQRVGVRAYVHSPGLRSGIWRGSLLVGTAQPFVWPPDELQLLRSVSNMLWLTLDKIRLLANLRASEEALRLSAERFRVALERSGMMSFHQDLNLRFTYLHNALPELAARQPLGKTEEDLLEPGEVRAVIALKQHVLETGEKVREELRFKFGSKVYYLDTVLEPSFDAQGQINGLDGSAVDVTARREAELAIENYTHQLERSNQELQDFAFIASHDLQEPLRKVKAFSDRLKAHGVGMDEEALDYIERMTNAAHRMGTMIQDLLDYSRVTTRARPFEPVDLMQVTQEVLSDLETRIEMTGGRVELDGLPTIQADAMQMRQLLQNLIGNGLKFHRPDVPPVVQVYSQPVDDNWIELVVADNGIGFGEQYHEMIFQPFTRLRGRSEYEGSGIGLAICRKIAMRHGGRISAKSQPGQGSTFVVTLPVRHE